MATQVHGTNPTQKAHKGASFFDKLAIIIGFIVEVVTAVLLRKNEAELQQLILQKKSIRKKLREIFNETDLFVEEKEQWRKFYQKHFSLESNFAELFIPEKPSVGSWRLLIIAQGLTLNQVYKSMSNAFKCWKYADDLDKSVNQNARNTTVAYALWVRDGVEPDDKYLGKSTRQADPDMKIGVTLLERMIHEIMHFDETGTHLDIKGVTFCSGSRYSDGGVPSVYWRSDLQKVRVRWYSLDHSLAKFGLREAVC
jgi:hypothetical protein